MDRSGCVMMSLLLWAAVAAPAPADSADGPAAGGAPAAAGRSIATEQDWREDVLFYLFAGLTVVSALGVVLSGSVVRMAMWLFAAFGAVAMLFFLLQAFFLGTVQLIVYVGGILVLIVFGIMLTSSSPWLKFEIRRRDLAGSGAVCLGLFGLLGYVLVNRQWVSSGQVAEGMQMAVLGKRLLTDYLVPFEVTSVLLLVVMIGAAYLAKQDRN